MTGVYACLCEAVYDVTTVPSHLKHDVPAKWFFRAPVAPEALFCRISLDDISGGRENFGMRLLHLFIVETDSPVQEGRVSKNALPKNF